MTGRVTTAAVLAAVVLATTAASAAASPVATDEGQYQAYGRVFPDPLGGCQHFGTSPCDPNAEGEIGAKSFVQYGEFVNALLYMNKRKDWQRYMEVWPLDGKLDPGGAGGREQTSGNARSDVPGNNLPASALEFTPNKAFISAGVPQSDLSRLQSDLIVVRVTDEAVPDTTKKRYALSLSIHGIERAGAEGGIRAMEDLVTAATSKRLGDRVLPKSVRADAPTFRDVLQRTIVYFTFPNPDGWRRGSFGDGGFSFQRYNGNGMDPNRDWPDIGFSYRFYSGISEPETKAFVNFYKQVMRRGPFAAGDDLHGQPFADALSYTMLPHGSHDWDKNLRLMEAAKRINAASYEATKWSPVIISNDQPRAGGTPCVNTQAAGTACGLVYAQTWGTVYDTINYTTTGALGDWFDSHIGANAEGIDNEMSFSHVDKDTRFDPHTEQLHVEGNKAIIFSHIAQFLNPPSFDFSVPGKKGYVPNKRVVREERVHQAGPPPGTVAQDPFDGDIDPSTGTLEFPVKHGPQPGGKNIYNGGLRAEVTVPNAQGFTPDTYPSNQVYLKVQCQDCDRHRGTVEGDEGDQWITVAEDFNQKQLYLTAGLTASVNQPQTVNRNGKAVKWRVVLENHPAAVLNGGPQGEGGPGHLHVGFTQDVATTAGNTGGDAAPREAAYDVANTDFIRDLNRFVPAGQSKWQEIDPHKVLSGAQSLDGLANLVLADDPLPGFTGSWRDPPGPPPPDIAYTSKGDTHPGFWQAPVPHEARPPGSYETVDFKVKPEQTAEGVAIEVKWTTEGDDWDLYLYRKTEDGSEELVSDEGTTNEGTHERINYKKPLAAGDYVIYVQNWNASDPHFTLTAKFTAGVPPSAETGEYTNDERDRWIAKLHDYVENGGNLVLTDGALRALSAAGVPKAAISQTTVYVGQVAFQKAAGEPTNKDVLVNAPLTINQRAARFNTGMRKQMYEPTPIGYAIQSQDKNGADQSNAVQWDVDRKAFEKVPKSRLVATSTDSGSRSAGAVEDRVAMGEIKVGKGQVRFLGALLPQPTEKFDHEFGLEPHAVTVAGYIIFRDLLASKEEQAAGTLAEKTAFYGKRKPRFLISKRLTRMNLRGVVPIRVSCRAKGGCRGTLTLKRGKRLLGKKKFSVKGNRRATLKVKLRPSGRASIRRRPRTRASARAMVRYADGTRERTKRVRLRISRPKG